VRRGLTQRTVLVGILIGAVVIAEFAVLFLAFASLRAEERQDNQAVRVLATSNALEESVLNMSTGLRIYLISGRPDQLAAYQAALAEYPQQVRELDHFTAGSSELHAQVASIGDAIAGYVRRWTTPIIRLSRSNLTRARLVFASNAAKQPVVGIRNQFATLDRRQQELSRLRRAGAAGNATLALGFGVAGLVAAVILLVLGAVGLHRLVVRPVQRLAEAAGRLRGGDLSARVPERGAAELGELAVGFNAMAQELEAARDEVEQQNAELQGQQAELQSMLSSVEQRKEEAETLRRFAEQLAAQTQIEAVAGVTLREIADFAQAQVGAVYVLNEQSGVITFRESRGARAGDFVPDLPPGMGLAGRAIAEQRPIAVEAPETSLRLPGLTADREIQHEVHLPLLHRQRAIGVLSLGRSRGEAFGPAETARLAGLTQSAALACAEALGVRRLEVLAGELESVMDSTDQGILRVDPSGRITYINRSALEQTGWTWSEVRGRNAHDLMHHTHQDGTPYPAAECPLLQAFRGGDGIRLPGEVFWRKDGSRFPVECSAYPIRDGDTVIGGVITFHDVSERMMAERQLTAQYRTAQVLAEAESVRDALPRVLELCSDQLGWQLSLVWAPDGNDQELHCLAAYAEPGREAQLALLSHETVTAGRGPVGQAWQGGRPVFVPGTGGPGAPQNGQGGASCGELAVPLTRNGVVVGVVQLLGPEQPRIDGLPETIETIAAQVTQYADRKRSDAAAARMKDQFVATVSHELRTPLAAMDGWLHILLDGEPGPLNEEQERFLTTVKRNSDRLMRLVGDLLLIGQMDAGRFTLELGEVDLAELVGETVALFEGAAVEKGIELTADIGTRAMVHGDRLRLGQLLSNLVSNAVKFTPAGGQVRVRVGALGGVCQVEVTDSGIGIPAGERGHLFERFYRASTATGTAGSGLGLAISKAIAEAHGGTIRIADSAGRGTRFVLEIPLHVAAEVSL
jgi:PAS domain S-box-containing protein